ncbi:unnamed protein product [Hymenolepis diminuta]|uniref:Tyrosine-protein phosphatase domain-containing protein n=2 Tax=Hymenolepis diminuta TaxID=6216 RepID=A0A0R3SEB2_HYMDI|nr:unnamed protein product [Hymenolepis diminuta]VUZ53745.1 unnamed protein product [Hymenolepis diminuta]
MGSQLTKIIPNLYIGSNETARDETELIANCITHILAVQSDDAELNKLSKYEYLKVYVGKPVSRALFRVIPQTNDFIHQARMEGGNVLVHSESGTSANVAVVAAYLMTLYDLNSKIAVSTIQGCLPPAHPTENLQRQLDRFDSTSPSELRGDAPISSESEGQRLLEKFGPWEFMERDKGILKEALDVHDEFKASGDIIITSGESRRRQKVPSPKPAVDAKISKQFEVFDEMGNIVDPHDSNGLLPLAQQDFDVLEQIPLTPSDSEKSLSEEKEVPGSIPVPIRTGSPTIFSSGSVSATRQTSKSQFTDTMFSMADDMRVRMDAADATARIYQNLSSTAPVFQDFTKRYLDDRSGRPK